jgi:hypothetical protein
VFAFANRNKIAVLKKVAMKMAKNIPFVSPVSV